MHIASKVDLEESFQIGEAAVQASMAGQTGIMMTFERLQNQPYQIKCNYQDVLKIANLEQRIPIEWINDAHNDITSELYNYLIPLIQGEVTVQFENGIPCYSNISHLRYK